MSAPDTTLDKQKRRHRGPLIGMALAGAFGLMLILYWLFEEAATTDAAPDVPSNVLQDIGADPDAAPVSPAPAFPG